MTSDTFDVDRHGYGQLRSVQCPGNRHSDPAKTFLELLRDSGYYSRTPKW